MVIPRAWAGMMRILIVSGSLRLGGQNMLSPCFMYAPINPLNRNDPDEFLESGFNGYEDLDLDLLSAVVQKYG